MRPCFFKVRLFFIVLQRRGLLGRLTSSKSSEEIAVYEDHEFLEILLVVHLGVCVEVVD